VQPTISHKSQTQKYRADGWADVTDRAHASHNWLAEHSLQHSARVRLKKWSRSTLGFPVASAPSLTLHPSSPLHLNCGALMALVLARKLTNGATIIDWPPASAILPTIFTSAPSQPNQLACGLDIAAVLARLQMVAGSSQACSVVELTRWTAAIQIELGRVHRPDDSLNRTTGPPLLRPS
jgi:hypothetical protein